MKESITIYLDPGVPLITKDGISIPADYLIDDSIIDTGKISCESFGFGDIGMYIAEQIANFFINISKDDLDYKMTNMQLNRLLYIAQLYYMHDHDGKPLFSDDIEAWEHGPVIYSIYKKYQNFENNVIDYLNSGYDENEIDNKTSDFLIELYVSISKYRNSYLRDVIQHCSWRKYYCEGNRIILPKSAIEKDFEYINSKIDRFNFDEAIKKIPRYESYYDENGILVLVR